MTRRVAGAWRAFQEFLARQCELQERLALINCPWEEEFFHWGSDGALHGHLAPPADGRRRSVTRDGWCPGARRAAVRAPRPSWRDLGRPADDRPQGQGSRE